MDNYEFTIENCNNNIRIDKFIGDNIDKITRSYAQKLIDDGFVLVNDKTIKANYMLKTNDVLKINLPKPKELNLTPQNIELDIVYEDESLLVVNKPQGMVVHPACGNFENTLVNALLSHCKGSLSQINGVIRPGIVHRIDKDTSGLLLVAKTNEAHLCLAKQLKEHTITRKYIAIVNGVIKNDEGVINAPIGRHPHNRKKMCVTCKNSKNAITHYKVLKRFSGYTMVLCSLETGRTHQIRVHMAYISHSLVGDTVYGIKKDKFNLKGQALFAKVIGFIHPKTNEYMEFEAPLPQYFESLISKLS